MCSQKALSEHKDGTVYPSTIMGIVFSAMAVEAFCNELAEIFVEERDLKDFIFNRGRYRPEKGDSGTVFKLRYLFNEKDNIFPNELAAKTNDLFDIRNNLVHYKFSDTAAEYEALSPKGGNVPDGVIVIDFEAPLEKIKPAFVERLTGRTATECFNTAFEVLESWGRLEGVANATGLEKIT